MSEKMTIPITLYSDGSIAKGDLYALSLRLSEELRKQQVDAIKRVTGEAEDGAKGLDLGLGANETQLLITLGTSVIPAIVLLLSNWLMRQKDQCLHIKIKGIEADIPRGMKPAEVEKYLEALLKNR
jgi:hypothetical protein